MPFLLPVLAGAGTLIVSIAGFIAQLFALIAGIFVTRFGWRLGIELAVMALVTAFTLSAIGAIKAALFAISFALPPEFVQGYNLLVPANFVPCLSAILSAKLVRWGWEWGVHIIYRLKNTANI